MADNVDLGTFTFNADSVVKDIENLRNKLFDLRSATKSYSDESRENEKQLKKLAKAQKELAKDGKKNSDTYKENADSINKLNARQKELFVSQEKTKVVTKEVNAEYREAIKTAKTLSNADGELVTATDAINEALGKEVKSIADARESNKELLALRNALVIADGENSEELAELNSKLDENNAFIKENVSAYEQQKIGIGDYKTAIEDALGGTNLFGVSLNQVKGSLGQFEGVFKLIKTEAAEATAGLKGTAAATEGMAGAQKMAFISTQGLTAALKLFRIALISTGIGAIVVVLGSLIAYLSTTQAGIDAVTSVTRPLSAVFQTLLGVMQNIGGYVFKNPLDALKTMRDFVKKQLVESFTGLGKIIAGIFTLDRKKINEGADQIKQLANDNAKALKDLADGIGDQFDEAWKKGKRIDELQKEIEKSEINIASTRSKATDELRKQENIFRDQTKSAAERNAAADEAQRIALELQKEEERILDLQIEQLQIKQSLNDSSREDLKLMDELIAKRIDFAARADAIERKTLSVRRQVQNEGIARAREAQDLAIKANQEQLALFRAEVGFKKKSDEEKLDIAKETRDREVEILEQELKFKRISIDEFNAKKLELNNDYLELERDIVIANAQAERDALLKNLDKRKNDYADYTEEKLELEKESIAERLAVEQDFANQQLEQGIINQEEYDAILSELKADARDAELEAVLAFDEANRERELIDLENQREIDEENFLNDFEIKSQRLELQRQQEIEAAEATGADLAIINEKYALRQQQLAADTAEAEKRIEEAKQQAKIQQAKLAFNMLSELLGKESKAGKAAAVAAAVINTFQGVTKALAEGGLIGIATGALVAASGAASIAKIVNTKTPDRPRAERGMRVPRGGTMLKGRSHAHGGIQIEAEGGEAIINKRSTSMFGGLLSAINVAGGGIPLAARGAIVGGVSSGNAKVQNSIMQEAFGINMTEMISDAVRDGSMEGSAIGTKSGSESGIIGLSENRQVQQNSSF